MELSPKEGTKPKRAYITLREKYLILSLYNETVDLNPEIALTDIVLHVAKAMQVGPTTVRSILREFRTNQYLEAPKTTKFRPKKGRDYGVIREKMPMSCAVANCTNYYGKAKAVGYFSFPKDENLCKEWVAKCRRPDEFNVAKCRICYLHFRGEDFERDLKSELLNLPLKKILKKGSIPSVNLPSVQRTIEKIDDRTNRYKIRSKKHNANLCIASIVRKKYKITTSHQELEIKPLEFVEVEDFSASTNGESLEQPSPSTITTNPPPDTSMVVVQPSSSQMEHGIKRKVDPPTTNPTAKKLHQTSDNSSVPEDEYELFCRSLICQLRNMPVDRAVICQEKLQSVMTQERLYQMGINYEQKSEPMVYDNIIVKEETDIDVNSSEY